MNERLRTVMLQRGATVPDLAEACEVDPKTVERWIAKARVPHRQHRWTAAKFLDADEVYLWPELLDREASKRERMAHEELIRLYPNRAAVPRDMWQHLLGRACEHVDILVYSGTFFSQTPHVSKMIAERATSGVKVRLCFGDPDSQAVDIRDREEGLRGTLASKIKAALTYFYDRIDEPGCEIRLHGTTLYASLFRYDNDLLVNPHAWGQPASANPLLHLRRLDGSALGVFDHYMASFDAIWDNATPWRPSDEALR